jgi:predicted ATPase
LKRQRFVISGGPGTGKSTLLDGLAKSGETCYEEVSRQLIREQKSQGGTLLPWHDLQAFANACVARMHAQLLDSDRHERAFFDRGYPDVVGYLRDAGLEAPSELRAASILYTPIVFFAPPWREIFVNDAERPQSYEESVRLSTRIRQTYVEFGFQIVELAKDTVHARVQQIHAHLAPRRS